MSFTRSSCLMSAFARMGRRVFLFRGVSSAPTQHQTGTLNLPATSFGDTGPEMVTAPANQSGWRARERNDPCAPFEKPTRYILSRSMGKFSTRFLMVSSSSSVTFSHPPLGG